MTECKKHFYNTFIPHKGNNYLPFLLRHNSLRIIASFVVVLKISLLLLIFFSPISSSSLNITNQNIINLTNQQRLNAGLKQLELNPLLTQAALAKAQDMLSKQYFSHYSPSNTSPWYWFKQAGYEYSYAGENLAMDFVQAEDVVNAWMASSSHRRNILNPNYTQIGVGVLEGNFKGVRTIIVVQMFGQPAPPATVTKLASSQTPPSTSSIEENSSKEEIQPETSPIVKEKTVILPSPAEENTYDVVTTTTEEKKTESLAEKQAEEPKLSVEMNDSSSELAKVGDNYVGSVKENSNQPSDNIKITIQDQESKKITVPVASTSFFKTPILTPDNLLSSERLIKMIFYSRNFFLALFILLSLVLILNVLIKIKVQHRPTLVYTLLVLYLIGVIIII